MAGWTKGLVDMDWVGPEGAKGRKYERLGQGGKEGKKGCSHKGARTTDGPNEGEGMERVSEGKR